MYSLTHVTCATNKVPDSLLYNVRQHKGAAMMFAQINTDPLWKNILSQVLTFLYSIAHYIGVVIVYLVNVILPKIQVPGDLVDPIGFLAIITIFLFLTQVAKNIATIIVAVGWILIVVRIVLLYWN